MNQHWTLLVIASVLLISCESGTGGSGEPETAEVVQLPERVVVTLESGEAETWTGIMEFEPQGDTLYIEGTLDGESTVARSYGVCEIDVLDILPTYLQPVLLECGEEYLAGTSGAVQ